MKGGPLKTINNDKPKDMKKTIKKFIHYMDSSKYLIIIAFILAIIGVCSTIISPNILGKATDEIIVGITTENVYDNLKEKNVPVDNYQNFDELFNSFNNDELLEKIPNSYQKDFLNTNMNEVGINIEEITNILLTIGIIVLISCIASIIQGIIMSKIAQKIAYKLRKQLSEKINKLPLSFFDKTNNGEIISHITNDVDTIANSLSSSLTTIISSIAIILGALIMMFRINIIMTLITLVIIPISLFIIIKFIKKSQKYFNTYQKYLGHINGHVEEMYGGQKIVKLFNKENQSISKMKKLNDVMYESSWKSQFLSSILQPVMNLLGNLSYVIGCLVGGVFVIKGHLSIGNVQAFIQYSRNFNRPIASIASIVGVLEQTIAAAERIFNFLENEDEVDYQKATIDSKNLVGNIEFKNVSFGYDKKKEIIKNFNLSIKAGEKIAIVGPTGAGKTTIVKLLMNFYQLNKGQILVDNVNIADVPKNNLRENIGIVLQDTWLFEGTIYDNILYGKEHATKEEIIEAAKNASVHHFISTLENNYDFVINEETNNVSEGEKQLLTIARTFLKDPKILILDEATSSVDTRTELLIQKAMTKLMKNKTSFIIAHRLSTIKEADKIIVMNHGKIVEVGNHNSLLKKNGFYTKLYNSQF